MGFLDGLFAKESKQSFDPYGEAKGAIDAGLGLLEGGMARQWDPYTGQLVAGFNPVQMQALQQMAGYGQGTGGAIENALVGSGLGLMPALGQSANLYQMLGADAPQVGQIDFDYARAIAESPYMDSQITAALRDPYRQFTEQTLPGIDMGANLAGQVSGSRAGVAEGIARRGYGDRASDIAAQMRSQAYGQGLGMAQQQAMQNPQLALSSQLAAAQGLQGIGNVAAGLLGQGYGIGTDNINLGLQSGTLQQQLQQAQLQSAYDQYVRNQQLPFLQAQMGLPLAQQAGRQFGTQTQTQNMGLGSIAAGIMGPLMSASMLGMGGPLAFLGIGGNAASQGG